MYSLCDSTFPHGAIAILKERKTNIWHSSILIVSFWEIHVMYFTCIKVTKVTRDCEATKRTKINKSIINKTIKQL